MDCRAALDILDAIRPGEEDVCEPQVAEALRHVESHAACRRELERRRAWDRQMSRLMLDVPVPVGLKERLLLGLAGGSPAQAGTVSSDGPIEEATAAVTTERALLQRRGFLRTLAAAASVAAAAGVVWWQLVGTRPSRVDWLMLQQSAAQELSSSGFDFGSLPAFDDPDAVNLPAVWQAFQGRRLTIEGPKAYKGKADAGEAAAETSFALYRLRFTNRRGQNVVGYVLALPMDVVSHPPKERTFAEAVSRYPTPTMQTAAWSSGRSSGNGLVYVCFLPPGNSKQQLEKLLRGSFG